MFTLSKFYLSLFLVLGLAIHVVRSGGGGGSSCIDNCWSTHMGSNTCPGGDTPKAKLMARSMDCVCSSCDMQKYVKCCKDSCGTDSVETAMNSACSGWPGPSGNCGNPSGGGWRKRNKVQFQPRGRSIKELQARVPRKVAPGYYQRDINMMGLLLEREVVDLEERAVEVSAKEDA
ncbi:hypothetical protein T439DRAFT_325534 [Meredithblackwellia eburnea MCA 4105]